MRIRHLLLIITLCLFTACAPDLGLKLSVPTLPNPEGSTPVQGSGQPVRVRVGKFMDARKDDTLAVIDGRKVASDGSLAAVVQEGLERYLKTAGANVVLFKAPTIEGEILDWRCDVKPGFPLSEATALARVKVTLRTENSKILYRGTYTGESTSKHPMLTEQRVRELLAGAMGSALEEVVHDDDFVAQLSRGRTY
jgi:hypothetical protein